MKPSKQPSNGKRFQVIRIEYEETEAEKWDLNKVKSMFVRDEIKKSDRSNPEDKLYIEDLLDLEHWIKEGSDNKTHDGLNIPYFSQDHETQVISRRKREYRKIFTELKGKSAYEDWARRDGRADWYTKKRSFPDNKKLLKKARIKRIGPKSFLYYACNNCGEYWAVTPIHNGIYARKGKGYWWRCPNGCNDDVSLP